MTHIRNDQEAAELGSFIDMLRDWVEDARQPYENEPSATDILREQEGWTPCDDPDDYYSHGAHRDEPCPACEYEDRKLLVDARAAWRYACRHVDQPQGAGHEVQLL